MSPDAATGALIPAGAEQTALQAYQEWSAGNQQAAIDRVRERADRGEAWATGLLIWLLVQQGLPGIEQAIPYARAALSLGQPWAAANLGNHLLANLPSAPHLAESAVQLISETPFSSGADPIGQGWNMLAQGQAELAVQLMAAKAPPLATPEQWSELVEVARTHERRLADLVTSGLSHRNQVDTLAKESIEAIGSSRSDLETTAKQAGLFVSSVNAASSKSLFDAEAERNAGESRTSWRWGIGVLVMAAAVAVLPLVLHYLGGGPDYSMGGLLAAHAGSTAALGGVSGVLLSRARGRDRAHQRARDLSTAMGTMISYSNQIQDEVEKQRFMLTMGQLVLQAHLQGDSSSAREDPTVGIAALLSAMRQPSTPA